MTKTLYTPKEVCRLLNIPTTTLRYWRDTFPQIIPKTTPAGHRRYTQKDIEVLEHIKYLMHERGLSIEYALKEMSKYHRQPLRRPRKCATNTDAIRLLEEARMLSDNTYVASILKSVEDYLQAEP